MEEFLLVNHQTMPKFNSEAILSCWKTKSFSFTPISIVKVKDF